MIEAIKFKWKVCVSCMTYNHASFIEYALNGFCIQETSFPFVCTIVDDASTDGEPEVIRRYLEENFNLNDLSVVRNEETEDYLLTFAQHKKNKNCYFAVFFLKYNHYQKKKNKIPYLKEWRDSAQYFAICEGDDYWINPNKLQVQVNYLDNHPDYTMVCNRTKLFSEKKQKYIGENYCYNKSQTVDPVDVIRRTGLFISTCSIIYCRYIIDNIPDYWKQCKVGDYPLQIMCAMKGKIYYFNDIMSVYRVDNYDSWMGRQGWSTFAQTRLAVIDSRIQMFRGFSRDYPRYEKIFSDKIADCINRNLPDRHSPKKDVSLYIDYYSDEIRKFPLKWRIDLLIRQIRFPRVRLYYTRFILRHYQQKKLLY